MVRKKHRDALGFTLIELLTVIAIIGILISVLIPTIGKVRETARRTVDASNIRQIGHASLIYASNNRERLPSTTLNIANGRIVPFGGTTTVHSYAAALAVDGGLDDSNIWVSGSDDDLINIPTAYGTIWDTSSTPANINSDFNGNTVSFEVVAGLSMSVNPSTPIAFTRGLIPAGTWDPLNLMYGDDGGHIVFLGGNVAFFKDVQGNDGISGELQSYSSTGGLTLDVTDAIPSTAIIYGQFDGSGTDRPSTAL